MLPLVEKIRPKILDEMILSENYREIFNTMIENKSIDNHLLLYGQPGSGKTTLAWIIVKSLEAEYLFINGSSERGIDVVRNKIEPFTKLQNIGSKMKIVFIDEYDKFSADAYDSMRPLLESSYKNCRFICTCNYIQKVPAPIQSRFMSFEFKPITKENAIEYAKNVILKGIDFDENDLESIYKISRGDMRRFINTINKSILNKKLVSVDNEEMETFIGIYKSKDLIKLKEFVVNTSLPFEELYQLIFEKSKFDKQVIIVADYMYKDAFVVDKAINFTACVCALWNSNK